MARLTKEQKELIVRLGREGYTQGSIADSVGCSRGTVAKVFSDNNIDNYHRKHAPWFIPAPFEENEVETTELPVKVEKNQVCIVSMNVIVNGTNYEVKASDGNVTIANENVLLALSFENFAKFIDDAGKLYKLLKR